MKYPDKMVIMCPCGNELVLKQGCGQDFSEYRNKCECGREWVLTEVSELMEEIGGD